MAMHHDSPGKIIVKYFLTIFTIESRYDFRDYTRGWKLGYSVHFVGSKAANDPHFMLGMCLGFHE